MIDILEMIEMIKIMISTVEEKKCIVTLMMITGKLQENYDTGNVNGSNNQLLKYNII